MAPGSVSRENRVPKWGKANGSRRDRGRMHRSLALPILDTMRHDREGSTRPEAGADGALDAPGRWSAARPRDRELQIDQADLRWPSHVSQSILAHSRHETLWQSGRR